MLSSLALFRAPQTSVERPDHLFLARLNFCRILPRQTNKVVRLAPFVVVVVVVVLVVVLTVFAGSSQLKKLKLDVLDAPSDVRQAAGGATQSS